MPMKKALLFIGVIILPILFLGAKAQALENRGAFTIADFKIDIELEQDSVMIVSEKITVDFSQPRHGIFRNIPIKYRDDNGFKHNFRFKLLSVENEQGNKWKYSKYKEGEDVVIKIGDPDLEISGRQVYTIKYKITRGVRFFDDHAEIFWNPVGTSWPAAINYALVDIHIPNDVVFAKEDLVCFTGTFGSRTQNCKQRIESANHLQFETAGRLQPFEGLTVAIRFPVEAIVQPPLWQKILWFMEDNWGFVLPVIVFGGMLYLWINRGKELNLQKTIIAQYDPPDKLTPGEMAYLLKEQYANQHVTADIVNLAVKGFLKINEIEDNSVLAKIKKESKYELENVKDWRADQNLTEHEQEIMKGFFGDKVGMKVEVSKLEKFYNSVVSARGKLKKQIKVSDYFEKHFLNYKSIYVVAGIVSGIIFVIGGAIAQRPDIIIGGIASGIILIVFGLVMSKKTRKGAEALRYAQGFRDYINTAERYRVKFQEDEKIFEKVLPYAMVFGLAEKWAKTFEGIYKQNPQWYSSSSARPFHPALFATSLNNSFGAATQSASTPPHSSSSSGFSGGGSSGGGGGGGGGGSW